ncbi:MAG TPA: thiamine phosphate synthase [Candidatus Binataceae bacterium]|nr:thiamine phosphate synthase [Candidatus Binataceae bacterium]
MFQLYLITDRKLAARHGGLRAIVEAALRAASTIASPGAVAVQLREKDLDAHELYELARALRELCSRYGAPLLVNDRLDVVMAAEADGVHLPANSFAVADARRLLGPSRLIGVSTHHAGEVVAAAHAGADFTVFGPVYSPLSKPAAGAGRGVAALFAAAHAGAPMPVYALGGITTERIDRWAGVAAPGSDRPRGAAVIGAVFGAEDPATATIALLRALSAAH